MANSHILDYYSFRARLCPALLVLFPAALAVFAWTGVGPHWESVIWTAFGTAGGTFLLAVLARNAGKNLEPGLWKSWGGPPTTQYLRHRGSANSQLRARWHANLSKLTGIPFPSAAEEAANPDAADEIYEAGVRLLINKTRDTKKYPLLFKENVNYGFCRNLLGLKWIGLLVGLAGAVACVVAGLMPTISKAPAFMPWILAVVCTVFLIFWGAFVKSSLVRVPANAYAQRLLESSETPPPRKSAKPKGQP